MEVGGRWSSLAVEKATRLGPPLVTVVASGKASGVKLCFTIFVMGFITSMQMTTPNLGEDVMHVFLLKF